MKIQPATGSFARNLIYSTKPLTCTSWHYSNSPKNRKTALSPRHDWLHGGSEQKKDPLRIWFFPQ
ncbi:serine/threonine protein kinase [Klebsiella quasipneumoniae]|uniref:serine/threonine protein kinase n=1 Tax=Klebsiella quasipneumoniae TaxID=1463165 RepID=UPI0034DF9787